MLFLECHGSFALLMICLNCCVGVDCTAYNFNNSKNKNAQDWIFFVHTGSKLYIESQIYKYISTNNCQVAPTTAAFGAFFWHTFNYINGQTSRIMPQAFLDVWPLT